MSPTRALLLLSLVGLLAAPAASAAGPDRQITKADQKRAQAMLIGKADLAEGFVRERDTGDDEDAPCAKAGAAGLVISGDAESLFTLERPGLYVRVGSSATLYRSARHAARSWRWGTSSAGFACFRQELAKNVAREGLRIESMKNVKVERLAPRTTAFRIVLGGDKVPVKIYFDVVLLSHGRAESAVAVIAAGTPVPDRDRLGFARLVASRMAKALGLPTTATA